MKVAIIAAYNEEDTIGSVVLRAKRHVDKVIVIDDGSDDKTAETAQLAGAKVVQHLNNGGKGEALKTGFEAAEKLNPDIVVCLDADCQHNPDDIPRVIAPILAGEAHMVIASRYLDSEHTKKIPRYRRLGLWVLTKTSNFGSSIKVTDTQSGFRAFSGESLRKFGFKQTGFSIESEMLEDAIEGGLRIKEISIPIRYEGLDTSTEKPGKHGLGVLNFIINTVREKRPLFYFGVSGAILLIIGLMFALLSIEWYFSRGFIPFAPSLAAAVAILLGALSIFAGLILNSISRMIKGLTKLSHSQKRTLIRELEEENIPKEIPSNVPLATIPYTNINKNQFPGLPGLNLHQDNMLNGNINQNAVPKDAPNDMHPTQTQLEDLNLDHAKMNHDQEDLLVVNIEEKKTSPIPVINGKRGDILPNNIEDKSVQL